MQRVGFEQLLQLASKGINSLLEPLVAGDFRKVLSFKDHEMAK